MAATKEPITATVTELPESRVKVDASVPASEIERAMQSVAGRLGKDMRLPGFRKGKVPAPVVIRQLGRDAVLDETVRGTLGRWYLDALDATDIHPVGDPDLALPAMPDAGAALDFSFEIGVRPVAQLGDYKGVEAPKPDPTPTEDEVAAEVDALRERTAKLETKEGAAATGDFLIIDFTGSVDGEEFEGGAGRDQLIELGSGRFIPGFEEQLEGAAAGEERTLELTFPDDYGAEHLAGKAASFAVAVKEVKAKELPELNDAFAEDAAGFDTLDELREDIAKRLTQAAEGRAEAEYREAVLDAVAAGATVTIPAALTEARARELWERMIHSLSHQGINRETYLQISGKTEDEVLEEAKPDAEQALRREAVLAAIIEAEQIVPTDGDVLDALQESADREQVTPEKLRKRLEKAGRLDDLREDLAQRQALDLIVEHATAITPERAKAREKLWTPGS